MGQGCVKYHSVGDSEDGAGIRVLSTMEESFALFLLLLLFQNNNCLASLMRLC